MNGPLTLLLGLACGLAALAAGCGGSDEPAATARAQTLPACASPSARLRRPRALPAAFPLPPGTVLTSSKAPHAGQLILGGIVPGELGDAADFFAGELPPRGYRLGRGDAEAGEEEAPFTGRGVRGRWRVSAIGGCPGAVTMTLVLIRQTP
ncbi:MAG: hypothetical protein H0T39_08335 [Actinobacteria bacterium]|nr:hypothetical protein [Actinomycetota bacterium]